MTVEPSTSAPDPAAVSAGLEVAPSESPGPTQLFAAHRSLLFTVAYEMLGSAADAEDVVQEVWVRWAAAHDGPAQTDARDAGDARDPAATGAEARTGVDTTDVGAGAEQQVEPIRNPRAYLVRITTRLALNRLRTVSRLREDYIGPWLPEPLLTRFAVPDISDEVVLSESVSLALLVVLESLAPPERAVFVLREVFGYGYDEIAIAVDRTPATVRQIAHRAREHVQARRPRFDTDPAVVQAVMVGFQRSLFSGDIQGLMDLMAPEVVLLSDGGGKRQAARRPVAGASNVARFMAGITKKATGAISVETVQVNGAPAWVIYADGVIDAVIQLVIGGGVIQQMLVVNNPDKLANLMVERTLSR